MFYKINLAPRQKPTRYVCNLVKVTTKELAQQVETLQNGMSDGWKVEQVSGQVSWWGKVKHELENMIFMGDQAAALWKNVCDKDKEGQDEKKGKETGQPNAQAEVNEDAAVTNKVEECEDAKAAPEGATTSEVKECEAKEEPDESEEKSSIEEGKEVPMHSEDEDIDIPGAEIPEVVTTFCPACGHPVQKLVTEVGPHKPKAESLEKVD